MRLFSKTYTRLVLGAAVILASAGVYSLYAHPIISVEAISSTSAAQALPNSSNPASSAGVTATKTVTGRGAPACQRGEASQPAVPAAVASQPGFHQNVQATGYYTIYGNTTDEINNQMADCTPVGNDNGRYAGSTDYALNWAFDYEDDGTGKCHVTAASVAINIATTLPRWQPSSGAAAGLNASWQNFITNLTTHESGHAKLDLAGAAQLLAHLQNLPATSCNTIVAQAASKATQDVQALNQANDNYDAATDHGLTQGAVLH